MACWTIRFCRALWASGFLRFTFSSQSSSQWSSLWLKPMSSQHRYIHQHFVYSLPEDPKYVLKKNSLLRKVRILIDSSFYSVQVPHNCLKKSMLAHRNATGTDQTARLVKYTCCTQWTNPAPSARLPHQDIFENARNTEKCRTVCEDWAWIEKMKEKGDGQIDLVIRDACAPKFCTYETFIRRTKTKTCKYSNKNGQIKTFDRLADWSWNI